jgi:hypothetical protein
LHSPILIVKNPVMAKISIAVNPRDLREALQKALGLVPDARVLGLLRALEKIATKRTDPEPFEVGVTSLQIVGGRFAIEPRGDDLFKESVVTSLLCRADKKMLTQLHSCLFEQLWRGDSEPAKDVGGESPEGKKTGAERGNKDSVPAQDSVPGPLPIGTPPPADQVVKPVAWESKFAKNNGDEDGAAAERYNGKGAIIVDERKIFGSIKSALDQLEFSDLLAVNVAAMEAVGLLNKGVSLNAPRCKIKRLSGCGDTLSLELESEEVTTSSLVRGLLGGLSFNSLMQLTGELLGRISRSQCAPKHSASKAL